MAKKRTKRSGGRQSVFFTYLIVIMVVVYLAAQFVIFINKDTTNYIIARQGEIVDSFSAQGVIVREEQLVTATTSGIVQYYYPGGKELQKGTLVCSLLDDYYGDILQEKIDEIYNEIADLGDTEYDEVFDSLDTNIAQSIAQYLRNKSVNGYSSLYILETNLKDAVSERKDMYSLMSNTKISSLLAEQGIYLGEQNTVKSNLFLSSAGVIDYSYDGYEGWTVDQIGADFLKNYEANYSYFEINLQSVQAGTPLYRLVSSPVWNIVIFLTGRITQLKQTGYDEYKLVLAVTERIQDFMNDRTANIVFSKNSHSGIKIADSCLVHREYYVAPKSYLMQSGADYGFLVAGTDSVYFQKVDVADVKEDTVYFSLPEGLSPGFTIQNASSDQSLVTGQTGYLYGVYLINGGYEQFESVDIIYQAQGYSIVKGINLYDRVKVNRE